MYVRFVTDGLDENSRRQQGLFMAMEVFSHMPHAKAQALSWFKDTSREHIAQIREYRRLLGRYGVAVEMLVTDRPGYIVYEDVFQIAAYPFSDTPT